MKLVFAGTPEFAVPTLRALVARGHDVALVLTQPDRPSGRGRQLSPSPVKAFALAHHLAIAQPATLRDFTDPLRELRVDAMIVVAYGLLLPPTILALPRFGCINVHASLLPRWRGAAPIARAIEAGDDTTGVTIMQMEQGLDTGPMLARAEVPILEQDTAATLHDTLAELGAEILIPTLDALERGNVTLEKQDEAKATYARKLSKEESKIDWRLPATQIARQVRALNPRPVAHAMLDGAPVRVWSAHADPSATGTPGTVLQADRQGILVATGEGALRIEELQASGGKRLAAAAFLNGRALHAGDKFD